MRCRGSWAARFLSRRRSRNAKHGSQSPRLFSRARHHLPEHPRAGRSRRPAPRGDVPGTPPRAPDRAPRGHRTSGAARAEGAAGLRQRGDRAEPGAGNRNARLDRSPTAEDPRRQTSSAVTATAKGTPSVSKCFAPQRTLSAGMDLRHLQAFLGHANLNTVVVYTQIGIKALKDLHRAMHPAASISRVGRERDARDLSAEDVLDALEVEGREEAEQGGTEPGLTTVALKLHSRHADRAGCPGLRPLGRRRAVHRVAPWASRWSR